MTSLESIYRIKLLAKQELKALFANGSVLIVDRKIYNNQSVVVLMFNYISTVVFKFINIYVYALDCGARYFFSNRRLWSTV